MSSTPRVYGGIDAGQRTSERRARFLAAGLEMLGSTEANPTLTVRGVCARAGLGARYFYESFEDGDAIIVAVYDEVIQEMAMAALAALVGTPAEEREQIRVALAAMIGLISEDPRKGRLLFDAGVTHPTLSQKRLETTRWFSGLLVEQALSFYGIEDSAPLHAVSRFLVGGLGETLTAWQHGNLDLAQGQLVELCTDIFQSTARLMIAAEEPQN